MITSLRLLLLHHLADLIEHCSAPVECGMTTACKPCIPLVVCPGLPDEPSEVLQHALRSFLMAYFAAAYVHI